MTKRIISLIIACVAFFTTSSMSICIACAEDIAMDGLTTTITVGYLPNYGIVNDPFVQGSSGYGYEYLSELEKYGSYKFEYELVPTWQEGLEKAKTEENYLFGLVSLTDERKEDYEFIDTSFCYESINVYSLKGSSFSYGNLEANGDKQLKVGTIEGAIYADLFRKYADNRNINYTIDYTDENTVVEDMKSGKIDLYVDGTLNLHDGVVIVEELYSEDLFLVTKKGETALAHNINEMMLALAKEEPYTKNTLWTKYYGNINKAPKSLTQDEKNALSSNDTYTVGYHTDLSPLSYKENGKAKGFGISVMNDIADYLDISVEYVAISSNAASNTVQCDFNLSVINDKTDSLGHFSEPYTHLDLMVLTHKKTPKKCDVKHIIAIDYSTIDTVRQLAEYTNAEIHMAYSGTEANNLLIRYPKACVVALEPRAQLTFSLNPGKEYSVSFLGVDVPLGITTSDSLSNEVVSALDKAILALDQTAVNEYIVETIAEVQNQNFLMMFLDDYGMYFVLLTVIVVAVLIFISMKRTAWHANNLKRIVEVEPVTGLMTLHKITQELIKMQSRDKQEKHAVILVSIDNFKSINQTYGAEKSEKLLCTVADAMRYNAEENTLMCRMHDDIFLIACKQEVAELFIAHNIGIPQHVCDQIKQSAGITMPLHFSAGVCTIGEVDSVTGDDAVSSAIDCANVARDISRHKYGNAVTVYNQQLRKKTETDMLIYNSMERAITEKEFFVVIQPKIELLTGKLVGGEALVRWKKHDGTIIYPDEFIPLFENNKFITKLDRYVFEEVCQYIKQSTVELPVISVNVSPNTILEEGFIDTYMDIISRYALKPQQFELELTEEISDGNAGVEHSIGQQLRELGFRLSIDDFGKDYSSLARVEEMVVDVIKLDKDFIANNFSRQRGVIVVSNIVLMAHKLGIAVLAEGIETQQQLDVLIDLGCEYGQGYLFDKPLSTADFTARVVADSVKQYPVAINAKEKMASYLGEFDNLPYAFALVKNDEQFTLINANSAFFDMLGYSREQFLFEADNKLDNIVAVDVHDCVASHIVSNAGNFTFEAQLIRKDGEVICVNNSVAYNEEEDIFYTTLIDITVEKKNEDEKNLYATLKQCIDHLYTATVRDKSRTNAIEDVLTELMNYYDSERAYYFTLSMERKEIMAGYEVMQEGKSSQLADMRSVPYSSVESIFLKLKDGRAISINIDKLVADNSTDYYVSAMAKLMFNCALISPVCNKDGDIVAIIVVKNPSARTNSLNLLNLLANYVAMYINSIKLRNLEKESQQIEESSKIALVDNVRTLLENYDNANEKINKVLDLLRVHYGARAVNILELDVDKHIFSMTNESLAEGVPSRFSLEQKRPAGPKENWRKSDDEGNAITFRSIEQGDTDYMGGGEWQKLGIYNTIVAQIYGSTSENNALLTLCNVSLTNRSKALIGTVARTIGDYLEKICLIRSHEEAIAIDVLSGLTNKVSTESTIGQLLYNNITGVLFSIDLDHFKDVNDVLGHSVGDKVIVEMSNTIRNIFRDSDIVGRVGGDEFMVFCPNPFPANLVETKAQAICQRCSKAYEKDGNTVAISASVGVLCINKIGTTFSDAYDRIDKALYTAKNNGRNQYFIDEI